MGDDDQGTQQARLVELRLKLRYENRDVMVERFAVNVGTSGVFLPTKTVHPVGTQVKFELRLADDTIAMVGVGTVRAARKFDPSDPYAVVGMSLELMRVSREGRLLLIEMMERRRTLGMPEVLIPSPEDIERARGLAQGAVVREPVLKPITAPAVDRRTPRTVRIPDVVRIPEPTPKQHANKPGVAAPPKRATPANLHVQRKEPIETPAVYEEPRLAEKEPVVHVEPAAAAPEKRSEEPAALSTTNPASTVVSEQRPEEPAAASVAEQEAGQEQPAITDVGPPRGSAQARRRRRIGAIAASLIAITLGAVLVYRTRGTAKPSTKAAPLPVAVSTPDAAAAPVPDQSARLVERAEVAISEGRIGAPPADNALEMIVELERQHPGDQRAQRLRRRAVDQLLASAQALWDHGKRDSARELYAQVLRFEPDNAIAKPRALTLSTSFSGNERATWLATQIDLAILDGRLLEPAGLNALAFLLELRTISSDRVTVNIGHELAHALAFEAKKHPGQAPTLLAAAERARGDEVSATKGIENDTVNRRPAAVRGDPKTNDIDPAKRWIAKGNASLAARRFADAATSFQNALAADASAPAALAGLAEAAHNLGEFQRAVDTGKRAVAQAPRNIAYRMTLAKSYYKLERYADAISQWQKVVEIDPANKLAKKNIAMAQSKM